MDRLQIRGDNRTTGQRLDEASCFDRTARQFTRHSHLNASIAALARDIRAHAIEPTLACAQALEGYDWSRIGRFGLKVSSPSDLSYFRVRAAKELTAAGNATDKRVRRVHLEMAERYQALISKAGGDIPARLHAGAS